MADASSQNEISLSIEETNALRQKLGLPPLELDNNEHAAAEKNYRDHQDKLKKEVEERAVKERIERLQNKAKLHKKLEGKGLGEADDAVAATTSGNSASDWVKHSRKLQRQRIKDQALAEKRAREQAELDAQASSTATSYTAEHLKGLKVAHDVHEFQEGEEQVLVLKDSTILDNEEEGDQLESVQMAEAGQLQRNLDNKKKTKAYVGYDDEEFTMTIGKKPSILSHYDEVIDGAKQGGFTLGSEPASAQEGQTKPDMAERLRGAEHSLDYTSLQMMNDYYTLEEAEVTFRKPRKSKKARKVRRRKTEGEDAAVDKTDDTTMQLDGTTPTTRSPTVDMSSANFVDDDDLQQALAIARTAVTKKRGKLNGAEDLAERVKRIKEDPEEADDALNADHNTSETSGEGLIFSDTTEFVRGLTLDVLRPVKEERDKGTMSVSGDRSTLASASTTVKTEDMPDEDITMLETDADTGRVKDEPDNPEQAAEELNAITDEPLVATGIAATMALLKQKGMIDAPSEIELRKSRVQHRQLEWQQEQRKQAARMDRERQEEKDRRRQESATHAGKRGYQYTVEAERREEEARYQEQRRQREWEGMMRDYRPDVDLVYTDKFGNRLNQKEAFRELSHKFHGKQSGKHKTEKRLRRMEEERRLNEMPNNDTPLGSAAALQERQRRTGTAHMVLQLGDARTSGRVTSRSHAPDVLSRDVLQ